MSLIAFVLSLLLTLVVASPVGAAEEFILQAPESEALKLVERQGLTLVSRVPNEDVFLVRGPEGVPPDQVIAGVLADPELDDEQDKVTIELNAIVSLPESGLVTPLNTSTSVAERALTDLRMVNALGGRVWIGYAQQAWLTRIRARAAHLAHGYGAGVVAVIDSGIDPRHPALRAALVPGYDFTRDRAGASELLDVEAGSPILNPTNTVIIDNTSIVRIGQATQLLAEPLQAGAIAMGVTPATFGHGTMVASLVRLVAPGAAIMPLKTFGADGQGRLYDVIRALYHAQVHGANVVNLSLNVPAWSPSLARAITLLHERQVFTVASVGNEGRQTIVFPAGLPETFGVASVTAADRRSRFSNYGGGLVSLAAPGEALIAAFPGAQYALAWGTSFSAPLVAGTVSLMLGVKPGINWDEVERALSSTQWLADPGLGWGRLNVLAALDSAAGVSPR